MCVGRSGALSCIPMAEKAVAHNNPALHVLIGCSVRTWAAGVRTFVDHGQVIHGFYMALSCRPE